MELNEKIQELRKQKGLTQEALAEALYVSRTAISKWESGRGYPSIDSLKALAQFFGVSIDALLSGDELLTVAQEDSRQKEKRVCGLVYGLLDVSFVMFFFLPLFRQNADGLMQAVSLLSMNGLAVWLKTAFFAAALGMMVLGVLTLAWQRFAFRLSLLLNALCALLFIISLQPYAAAFSFLFLLIKGFLLLKRL